MRGALSSAVIIVVLAVWAGAQAPSAPAPPGSPGRTRSIASASAPASARALADPAFAAGGVDAALDEAFALIERRAPRQAEAGFAALSARTDLTDRQRARALRGLGQSHMAQQRRDRAAGPLGQALEAALSSGDRVEVGWARQLIGMVHYGEGRIEEARAIWTLARSDFVETGDAYGEFEVLADLSLLVTGVAGRPLLERALAIARDRQDPLLEARARARWGHALLDGAHPGAALVELERAVALMRPLGKAYGYLADALALLGWALRSHGAHDRAVPVHQEAIRLARAHGELHSQIWNYLGLGVALAELGDEQRAASAISRGLAVARQTGLPTNVRFLAQADGWIALKQRQWARAAAMLEKAQAMPGLDSTVLPLVHLAHAYRELGRLDDALESAARAIELARTLEVVDGELRAIIEMAHVRKARGELDLAEENLSEAITRLESYRAALAPMDFLKQGFDDRFADAYGVNVALLMRCGRAADALAAAERSRSRAFADLLATRRVIELEDAETASGRWALGGPEAVRDMTPRPTPADSLRWIPALSASELAALARGLGTTFVVYWIHDAGSFAWVVRADGQVHAAALRTEPAALKRAVQRAVDDVPEAVLTRSAPSHARASAGERAAYRALYHVLWGPVEKWLPQNGEPRITILPHGPLFTLSFGALVDGRGRYLIERFALHYAASGAVLSEAAARVRRDPAGETRALLVADPSPLPSPDTGVRLPPLEAARQEVRAIAPMVNGPVELLVGRRASEAAVRTALPRARLVHFATHAVVRDSDPLGSHLMLAATEPAGAAGAEGDGHLTASEITGFTLSSDLVVLGACRSARGSISSDGIAGLTRAFMAAGAPSVVATLWEVPDEPTSRVMKSFYRAYLAGVSKDQALRAAQLRLLRDLRAGRVTVRIGATTVTYPDHPHLWAGTILVGAP